jgi:ankyrin repeat protein
MKTVVVLIAVCGLSRNLQAQMADFSPPTPLLGALMHNDTNEAKRLLDEGADPNRGGFGGFSSLMLAISPQNLELVRMMAAKAGNLEFPRPHRFEPPHVSSLLTKRATQSS